MRGVQRTADRRGEAGQTTPPPRQQSMTSRVRHRVLLSCVLPAACGLLLRADSQATRTVWDGVYTEAQAERGRASYQQSCLSCHRDDLRGDNTAPSLVGESFLFLWGDMEVGELSARIQKLMPPERPGSCRPRPTPTSSRSSCRRTGFPPPALN